MFEYVVQEKTPYCTFNLKKNRSYSSQKLNIQGGALNRGLFFADPPPSLLGL
jgi:hypothetical protein